MNSGQEPKILICIHAYEFHEKIDRNRDTHTHRKENIKTET